MDSSLPKKFCDDPATLVDDSIDGLVKSSGGTLKRLDGYRKGIRVVIREDFLQAVKNAHKVALVTGGGSGHEPAHAGFLGEGMLTAAVCGDVFASPTVEAILAAIKAVTGPAGCLLIIKNYTGDRLNFGLAAEKARSLYGLNVQAIVVADDVALPGAAHPRGTAGTLLIHRFAGKLAEEGKSLDEIVGAVTQYERQIVSVGASLTTCNLPGIKRDPRLDGPEYELGLGIHGEPGAAKLPVEPASKILERMLNVLLAGLAAKNLRAADNEFTLLVNNLGGVPPIEMSFLSGLAISQLGNHGVKVSHVAIGTCMTSLDMNGFSLSLAAHAVGSQNRLLGRTRAPAWPTFHPVNPVYHRETRLQPSCLIPLDLPEEEKFGSGPLSANLKEKITNAMHALIGIEAELTEWDQKTGDGDCGHTFQKGATAILADLDTYPDDPVELCQALSKTIGYSMGGTSGVLLSMFFLSAAADIKVNTTGDPLTTGFRAGVTSVMHYGGATVGSRTMVDALAPAVDGTNIREIAQLAQTGADHTQTLGSATHGRAQYLAGSDLAGIPDPGAVAVATILQALAK